MAIHRMQETKITNILGMSFRMSKMLQNGPDIVKSTLLEERSWNVL